MAVAKRPVRVMVQFRLGDSAAQSVSLVGDFTGWRPEIELRQVAPGVWVYEVPLEPGVYNYGFLVDGKIWRPDPLAPQVSDGFGGANSRLTVLAPEAAS
jgi:1,4-alpha-glucan branching enzyme